MARELAEAQSSVAELAAGKQALESSLAATKASLQACEDKLVSAEVIACSEILLMSSLAHTLAHALVKCAKGRASSVRRML